MRQERALAEFAKDLHLLRHADSRQSLVSFGWFFQFHLAPQCALETGHKGRKDATFRNHGSASEPTEVSEDGDQCLRQETEQTTHRYRPHRIQTSIALRFGALLQRGGPD